MFDDYAEEGWMEYGWTPGNGTSGGAATQCLTQQEYAFLNLPAGLLFSSALFQGRYVRRRERVRNMAIRSTYTDRVLYYTGECLDQFDLDVLLACAQHFPKQTSLAPLNLKLDLRAVSRTVLGRGGQSDLRRVVASLRRLEAGRIKVRDGRFTCFLQPVQKALFDTLSNTCMIELNPEMLRSLQSLGNYQVFIRERFSLRKAPMDRWLHGMVRASSSICIPFEGLPELSGNAKAQPGQVEESLNRLRASMRLDHLSLSEGGLEISRQPRAAGGAR